MGTLYSKLDSLCEERIGCLSHESLGVHSVSPPWTLCPSKNTDLDELLREIEVMRKTPRN